jgi:hypothetical protein
MLRADSLARALAVADSVRRADSTAAAAPPLPNTGTLALQGVPARARVTVDGEVRQGTTLTVDAGSRSVEIRAPGYEPYRVTVPVRRGGDTTVAVRMTRLQQTTPPADATPVDVCATPGPGYNKDSACFDSAPRAQAAPIVPLTDQVQGTPTRAMLWVLVSAEGRPLRVQVDRASNDPQFTRLAQGFALSILYTPAHKSSQPVEGWVLMQFVPAPR